jgi:hypothetical protein
MPDCKQCGAPITNKFCSDYCVACIEAAMEDVTTDAIAKVLRQITREQEPLGADFEKVWDDNVDKLYEE